MGITLSRIKFTTSYELSDCRQRLLKLDSGQIFGRIGTTRIWITEQESDSFKFRIENYPRPLSVNGYNIIQARGVCETQFEHVTLVTYRVYLSNVAIFPLLLILFTLMLLGLALDILILLTLAAIIGCIQAIVIKSYIDKLIDTVIPHLSEQGFQRKKDY